jgi:hypothetical protein
MLMMLGFAAVGYHGLYLIREMLLAWSGGANLIRQLMLWYKYAEDDANSFLHPLHLQSFVKLGIHALQWLRA